jgi:hypothetical protein
MNWKSISNGAVAGLPGALRGLLGYSPGKLTPREAKQ